MLPCNVVIQELSEEKIEVAAIDPVASMKAIDNHGLAEISQQVQQKLQKVIDNI